MYDNVIVSFDGALELRAALAPAADLAWRCGAKLVVVTTTTTSDEASRLVLKSQAIAKSGADIDFWADLDHDIGPALAAAGSARPRSLICVASRYRTAGVLRRRRVVIPLPSEVFARPDVPVMVIGPETDVSRGLAMTEVVVAHDGSPQASAAVVAAMEWGERLRLAVRLVGVVDDDRDHRPLTEELERALEVLAPSVPEASLEVIRSSRPAAALTSLLADRSDAVAMLATRGLEGRGSGPLGPVAAELVTTSPRPLVLFPTAT